MSNDATPTTKGSELKSEPLPEAPNLTQPTGTLWCVHIPGPDDLYAWPTQEIAQDHADRLNAAMRRFWEREPRTEFDPTEESMTAVVIPWPWSPESHASSAIKNVKAECRGNA